MRRAVKRERRQRLDELLDAGVALDDLTPPAALTQAETRLAELSAERELHRSDRDYDPMWHNARPMLVDAAAILVQVLDTTPRTATTSMRCAAQSPRRASPLWTRYSPCASMS
jgi:hypothetical protein